MYAAVFVSYNGGHLLLEQAESGTHLQVLAHVLRVGGPAEGGHALLHHEPVKHLRGIWVAVREYFIGS
eukprot:2540477-Pyramimonas_sp.AAC.1